MAYAEKRGKGPAPWRVKYKREDGSEDSQSGFETKRAALDWGNEQEAKGRRLARGEAPPEAQSEPEPDDITVDEWAERWMAAQDVGISTTDNRKYLIRRFLHPQWGPRLLRSLTSEEVNAWEKGLPAKEQIKLRTARDARGLLCTMLGDAATARPRPLIPFNPALRQQNRGKRTGRRLAVSAPRTWATPLEALLTAERAALLSGQDDDFTMLITIAYTGLRWGETVGLEREFLHPALINVEWQLRELNGKFYRLPPKDDSYRSLNWEPRVPVDLPPFLAAMLARQARSATGRKCPCASVHEGGGRYLFTGPDGGHHRRSDYARRVFRPAADGRYPPEKDRPGKLVIVDAATWPGCPVAAWPQALPYGPLRASVGERRAEAHQHQPYGPLPGLRALHRPPSRRRPHRPPGDPPGGPGTVPGQPLPPGTRPLPVRVVARQDRIDTPRPPAQPQDVDGGGRHSGDPRRAPPRPRGPRHARPVLARLPADAGGPQAGPPGPLGGVAQRARGAQPRLTGTGPRHPA